MEYSAVQKTLSGENLFKNTEIPVRNAELYKAVKEASRRMGQHSFDSVTQPIYDLAQSDLQYEVEMYYKNYSMEEIKNVLHLGSTGKLGDNFSISSKTVIGWFTFYNNGYRRELIKKIKANPNQKQLPEKTKPKFTKEDALKHLREAKLDFDEGRPLLSYVYTYDILDKYGIINFSTKEKIVFYEQAKAVSRTEAKEKVSKGELSIGAYKSLLNIDKSETFETTAKRLALKNFFENWDEYGVE